MPEKEWRLVRALRALFGLSSSTIPVVSEEELPFIRAILSADTDMTTRLVYADWLEEHGSALRAEYLRLWVELNDPTTTEAQKEDRRERRLELFNSTNPQWRSLVAQWHTPVDDRDTENVAPQPGNPTDAKLGYGSCCLCGWSKNVEGGVSRMPCEACGRVFCWRCADTGVFGSLSDFEKFVSGRFRCRQYRLGSGSCLFCQKMDWMLAHGG